MLFILFAIYLSAQAVIFGSDDRVDIVERPSYLDISRSVAMSVSPVFILPKNLNFLNLDFPLASSENSVSLCSEEKFSQQPANYINCTGFLVADDILVTAGHCLTFHQEIIKDQATPLCTDFDWIFDFKKENDGSVLLQELKADRVYRCKRVIYAEHLSGIIGTSDGKIIFPALGEAGNDFAIIQLDRKVIDRTPLPLSLEPVHKEEFIFTIGYPGGLPLKISENARVYENRFIHYFTANLDIIGGNSGGPVFNSSNQVVGIVVRSFPDEDYSYDEIRKCQKVEVCEKWNEGKCAMTQIDEIPGSHINRIDKVIEVLKTQGFIQ